MCYTVDPRLTGPQLSESLDYPEGKYRTHAQTIPRGRLEWNGRKSWNYEAEEKGTHNQD